MSKQVNFYTIAFEDKEENPIECSVMNFFENIEETFINLEKEELLVREIGGKTVRLFPYYRNNNSSQIVIPLGKLKEKNKPYGYDASKHKLAELPMAMYDINSIAYDKTWNLLLITTNREGPTLQNITDYFNSFVPNDYEYRIVIRPIYVCPGLKEVRNAKLVKSVTFNLDLSHPLNNFYLEKIGQNEVSPLTKAFKSFVTCAKTNGGSKKLALTMNLGKGKKSETLDINEILSLLNAINIDQAFVKEIIVDYMNGEKEKVSEAKLKNSSIIVFHPYSTSENQISPEFFINHMTTAIEQQARRCNDSLETYLHLFRPNTLGDFKLVKNYLPDNLHDRGEKYESNEEPKQSGIGMENHTIKSEG